jgi:hypothetical protein
MHLLLFERSAHLLRQLVEKLSHGAVVEVAGILRKNLAGEDRDRLAMTGVSGSGIGIDNFAASKHPGQKRGAARRAFRHPEMGCPNGFLEIIGAPGRTIARPKPNGNLELAPRPFRGWHKAKGFHRGPPTLPVAMLPADKRAGNVKNNDPPLEAIAAE